jgi:hypothetical protein
MGLLAVKVPTAAWTRRHLHREGSRSLGEEVLAVEGATSAVEGPFVGPTTRAGLLQGKLVAVEPRTQLVLAAAARWRWGALVSPAAPLAALSGEDTGAGLPQLFAVDDLEAPRLALPQSKANELGTRFW